MDRVETIKSWYKDCLKNIQAVHSIFIDTFGEDRVDLQDVPSEQELLKEYLAMSDSDCRNLPNLTNFPIVQFSTLDLVDDEDFIKYEQFFREVLYKLFNHCSILIYFPEVIIRNEEDQTHTIKELYAKVEVTGRGLLKGYPLFNRAKYTRAELEARYMHSHIYSFNKEDFSEFQSSCLGSGPINNTVAQLSISNATDRWILFANQIDQYVRVESTKGGPYHYMSNIGTVINKLGGWFFSSQTFSLTDSTVPSSITPHNNTLSLDDFQRFTVFLCNHFEESGLFLSYSNNSHVLGNSVISSLIAVSNLFIKWFNNEHFSFTYSDLLQDKVLLQGVRAGAGIKLYYPGTTNYESYSNYIGEYICTFKGQDITLVIEDYNPAQTVPEVENSFKILNPLIVGYILQTIVTITNLKNANNFNLASAGHIYQA